MKLSARHIKLWSFDRSSHTLRFLLLGVCLTLCLLILSRYQISNGFTLLQGDRYDAVIASVILEHWFHVFSGHSSWTEVNYFYPYTKTIAQTDAYFLVGIAYFPFRFFGLDPFVSIELANLLIKASGFIGIYLLCTKVFSLSFYWALLAAVLFTLSNGMTIHGSRIQLATVAFAPILALLVWSTIKGFIDDNKAQFIRSGITSGVFFGAWCLTCFYAAWFFLFFISTYLFIILFYCRTGPVDFSLLKARFMSNYGSVCLVLSCAFLSLLPFIYVFLSKSFEVGVRSYASVFEHTVPLEGILQVGYDNFLFGTMYNHILTYTSPSYSSQSEYYNTGFPFVLFFLLICGCLYFLRSFHQKGAVLLKALVLTLLLTWVLILKVGGHSAWFFVYHLFPGAKALNVVSAYQLFLALPVVIIAVKYLSTQRLPAVFIGLIVTLLILSEFNKPYFSLDPKAEDERVQLPYPPPKACRAFYVSGLEEQNESSGWANNSYAHSVIAMRIAQITGIPTINGIASFSPVDSNFSYPNRPDYEVRVLDYAKKYKIEDLCRLDLNTKQWTMLMNGFHLLKIGSVDLAQGLDFSQSHWPGMIDHVTGLSTPESWGTWSDGATVVLEFVAPLPKKFIVHLNAQAFGPNVGQLFTMQMGSEKKTFSLDAGLKDVAIAFDNHNAASAIIIDIPYPTSPKSLGQSLDPRHLGIGLHTLRIETMNE